MPSLEIQGPSTAKQRIAKNADFSMLESIYEKTCVPIFLVEKILREDVQFSHPQNKRATITPRILNLNLDNILKNCVTTNN